MKRLPRKGAMALTAAAADLHVSYDLYHCRDRISQCAREGIDALPDCREASLLFCELVGLSIGYGCNNIYIVFCRHFGLKQLRPL